MQQRREKLIEVALPLDAINEEVLVLSVAIPWSFRGHSVAIP